VSEFERWYSSLPRMPIIVPNEGAQVVIVKFADYQCPGCANVYFNYKSVLAKYQADRPGAVKMVMKDYPLEPECNPGVAQVVHESACEAAAAVRMAKAQKRDAELEEWLYANQSKMTPESVKKAAKDIGHVDNFDAQYQKMLESVRRDADFGKQMGVNSTPTFFINGVKVDRALQPQYFDAAIAYELRRAGTK
jgi:protein-disulfide isomerase